MKSWFFEKVKKNDKPLGSIIKKKKKKRAPKPEMQKEKLQPMAQQCKGS